MTSVIALAPVQLPDRAAAIEQFEAWVPGNPYAPYFLRKAEGDDKHVYSNERTEAAYRGFVAGLAAPGKGSIKSQFEAWASSRDIHGFGTYNLELSSYYNYRWYHADRTQHAYEGFIAAYQLRMQPRLPVYAAIHSGPTIGDGLRERAELRAALEAERALTAKLTAQLAKYERLQHPELLYTELHQGFPARLPQRWFHHLANCADDTLLPAE